MKLLFMLCFSFLCASLYADEGSKFSTSAKTYKTKFICSFQSGETQHPMHFKFIFDEVEGAAGSSPLSHFKRAYAHNKLLTWVDRELWKDEDGNLYTLEVVSMTGVGDTYFWLGIRYSSNTALYVCREFDFGFSF